MLLLQGTEETLDHNWERSSNSKVEILLQFCKMRKQANWTKISNYFNLNCSFTEGTLREKQREVLMNCEACRTWDTMSTGGTWNIVSEMDFWSGSERRFDLIFDVCQGGDGCGAKDETKLRQFWRDSTYRSSCRLCCLNILGQNAFWQANLTW